jgi:hypothetical protein
MLICIECEQEIEGEATWFNAFTAPQRVGDELVVLFEKNVTHGRTASESSPSAVPFHHECFLRLLKEAALSELESTADDSTGSVH